MKHFILPFARTRENKLKPKPGEGVRAINTKRPRQQLSSRAKISKVVEREREREEEMIRKTGRESDSNRGERGRGNLLVAAAASSPMATLLLAA